MSQATDKHKAKAKEICENPIVVHGENRLFSVSHLQERIAEALTAVECETNNKYREALELIAAPKRTDGTYNRSREACEQLAREALDKG